MKATWDNQHGPTISPEELAQEGVLNQHLSVESDVVQRELDELKQLRGYVEQDEIALSPTTPDLETILAKFSPEHCHDDDEVRFVLDGAGIFDIRSREDRWMHVVVGRGDLIVVPAHRNHRFFLTELQAIRAVRLFKDRSGWTPHYREALPQSS